jgi:hypothetical protein
VRCVRGWTLKLNADGTTTATNPDGRKTLRSHMLAYRCADRPGFGLVQSCFGYPGGSGAVHG